MHFFVIITPDGREQGRYQHKRNALRDLRLIHHKPGAYVEKRTADGYGQTVLRVGADGSILESA